MANHLVLGTAGHIDHGKSALVQALTGVDPDRLKEEKRRGITIELGFADMQLDDERIVSFVDVPGHERFVRHMVAGATGIEAVLLVVAADQGVQPQTGEHLDICSLLGIERGIIALTKSELVDDELREVVALEVRERVEGTFLAEAPLIEVSARTGQGLDELRAALATLFEDARRRPATGVARLPVDRSFVLKGFGTVVTGTLVSGTLSDGDEVEVLPGGRRGRVRGLQVHHQKVDEAPAGRRTAVNLQGLDCSDVPRGSTLTTPGALQPTRRLWARLTLLPDTPKDLRRGGGVRFHQGTWDGAARFRVLASGRDGSHHVELRLTEPAPLAPGDRFILRRPAPVDTVGGGVVIDAHPPSSRAATAEAFSETALSPTTALRLRLARAGAAGREAAGLAAELGLTVSELESELAAGITGGEIVTAGGIYLDADQWAAARGRVLEELDRFHEREPLRLGIAREVLRARTNPEIVQEPWRALLDELADQSALELSGERVARAGHQVVLDDERLRLAERLERRFQEAALEPPDPEQALEGADRRRGAELLDLLVSQGKLVRIHDGKIFHAAALEELRRRLSEFARESRTIDVAGFKKLAGVSRKHAIPLLEHLDAERSTRRLGNQREILV